MFNLCSEKTYDTSFFHGRVERVLIDDHNVPSLKQMLEFADKVSQFVFVFVFARVLIFVFVFTTMCRASSRCWSLRTRSHNLSLSFFLPVYSHT